MTERGTIVIDRGLFGHSRFADEPFTEREAWAWLIAEAAFRPHCRRVGTVRVELKRGQLAHSTRYMAEAWQWPQSNVRRFLARLAEYDGSDEPLIELDVGSGVTVVTIRKYNDYQPKPDDVGSLNGSGPAQDRLKEESIDKGSSSREDARARENPDYPVDADYQLASAFLTAIEREPDDPWLSGIAYQAVVWRKRGYTRETILADAAEIITGEGRRKVPLSYYFSAIERRHVQREQQARAGPSNASAAAQPYPGHAHVVLKTPHAAAPFQQSRDRFREALADLNAHVAGQSAHDDGEGSGCEIVQPAAAARRE